MDKPTSTISDELLARYLASKSTPTEIERVEAWLEESSEHIQELKDYRVLWERSKEVGKNRAPINTDAAWRSVQSRMHGSAERLTSGNRTVIDQPTAKIKPLPVRRTAMSTSFWAAAMITLAVVAFGWIYFTKEQPPQLVSVSTQQNTYEKTLPDGSKVYLNYNSTLTYQENLSGNIRLVSLQGEAFFEVSPDPARPFVIDANGTEIKVLGTSFNVKAYDEVVRVDVKTGKVEVAKSEHKVQLLPGEGVEVKADTVFKTIQANINIASYSTQVFEFTEAHLDDVAKAISEGYHVRVRLSDETLAQCRITARYEKEPLDATLSLIAETMTLTVRRDGDTYWLEGNGCQ